MLLKNETSPPFNNKPPLQNNLTSTTTNITNINTQPTLTQLNTLDIKTKFKQNLKQNKELDFFKSFCCCSVDFKKIYNKKKVLKLFAKLFSSQKVVETVNNNINTNNNTNSCFTNFLKYVIKSDAIEFSDKILIFENFDYSKIIFNEENKKIIEDLFSILIEDNLLKSKVNNNTNCNNTNNLNNINSSSYNFYCSYEVFVIINLISKLLLLEKNFSEKIVLKKYFTLLGNISLKSNNFEYFIYCISILGKLEPIKIKNFDIGKFKLIKKFLEVKKENNNNKNTRNCNNSISNKNSISSNIINNNNSLKQFFLNLKLESIEEIFDNIFNGKYNFEESDEEGIVVFDFELNHLKFYIKSFSNSSSNNSNNDENNNTTTNDLDNDNNFLNESFLEFLLLNNVKYSFKDYLLTIIEKGNQNNDNNNNNNNYNSNNNEEDYSLFDQIKETYKEFEQNIKEDEPIKQYKIETITNNNKNNNDGGTEPKKIILTDNFTRNYNLFRIYLKKTKTTDNFLQLDDNYKNNTNTNNSSNSSNNTSEKDENYIMRIKNQNIALEDDREDNLRDRDFLEDRKDLVDEIEKKIIKKQSVKKYQFVPGKNTTNNTINTTTDRRGGEYKTSLGNVGRGMNFYEGERQQTQNEFSNLNVTNKTNITNTHWRDIDNNYSSNINNNSNNYNSNEVRNFQSRKDSRDGRGGSTFSGGKNFNRSKADDFISNYSNYKKKDESTFKSQSASISTFKESGENNKEERKKYVFKPKKY